MREELKAELDSIWKEKLAVEKTEDQSDLQFIPAKEAEKDDRPPLIHVEL